MFHNWSVCAIILTAIAVKTSHAACCSGETKSGQGFVCEDGSATNLVSCCGVGKCNIFCCACNGGCKQAQRGSFMTSIDTDYLVDTDDLWRKKRSPVNPDQFDAMDENGDGQIYLAEIYKFNKKTGGNLGTSRAPWRTAMIQFKVLDLNRDGFLSRTEIGA